MHNNITNLTLNFAIKSANFGGGASEEQGTINGFNQMPDWSLIMSVIWRLSLSL